MMRQDINPTLSNESSSSSAAASTSGKLTLGFSGLSNAHRHIQLGLHQYVAPHNIQELHEIHANARPTAVAYVSTIFLLYLIGLGVIVVHYMNSSYGSWTWNLDDLWEELRPAFTKPKPKWETKTRETENYCPKDLASSDKERNRKGSKSDEDVERKQRRSTHGYCEVEVHGDLESEDYTAAAASGRRQRNAVDVDGNGGRSHGGIDIQINDGDEKEEEEEVGGEEDEGCATNDAEEALCIAATTGDRSRSVLNHLRWKSGGGGGDDDAKVRFPTNLSTFAEK